MIEKPPLFPAVESAEKAYEIDSHEIQTRAFLQDPIAALQNLRDEVLEEHGELDAVALVAIDHLEAVRDVAYEEELQSSHPCMQAYLETTGIDSYENATAIVQLLHEAGYSQAEVITWAKVARDNDTSTEELANRGLLAIVRHVYAEEEE